MCLKQLCALMKYFFKNRSWINSTEIKALALKEVDRSFISSTTYGSPYTAGQWLYECVVIWKLC